MLQVDCGKEPEERQTPLKDGTFSSCWLRVDLSTLRHLTEEDVSSASRRWQRGWPTLPPSGVTFTRSPSVSSSHVTQKIIISRLSIEKRRKEKKASFQEAPASSLKTVVATSSSQDEGHNRATLPHPRLRPRPWWHLLADRPLPFLRGSCFSVVH